MVCVCVCVFMAGVGLHDVQAGRLGQAGGHAQAAAAHRGSERAVRERARDRAKVPCVRQTSRANYRTDAALQASSVYVTTSFFHLPSRHTTAGAIRRAQMLLYVVMSAELYNEQFL
jgi:hypothetical protein